MVKNFTRFCTAFLLAFLLFTEAKASHITGSDISYHCLGNNQYEVIVTIYRDCSGINVSPSISVSITSSGCGLDTSIICSQIDSLSGIEVSQLCGSQISSSTCNGGSLPGVQLYTFSGVVTLPPNCGIYTFSYGECCRNNSNNLVNSSSYGYSVSASMNSNIVSCESAPNFTSLPTPYFCLGQAVNYSHGAVDADGDSLVYTLINPLDDAGLPLAYQPGFDSTNPMPTGGGFGFDAQTGQMTFVPNTQGVYVVDVLVREYRNGVLIGTTMRDIQIIIINCNNAAPSINASLSSANVTGASIVDYNSLGVCPGQTVTFTLTGYDPNGQPITVTSNIATSIPGATLTTTNVGGPDSVIVTFTWTPSGLDTGFRYFTVQFEDNACPIPGIQLFTYDLTVLAGTEAGPNRAYCTGSGPVPVHVYGGNHFSWTPTTGMVSANTDSSLVYFAPSVTTTYYVVSDLMGGCKNRDTITIANVNTFSTSITSPDDTICLYGTTTLTVTSTPSSEGPFTYNWAPLSQSIVSPASASTQVKPSSTTMYQVTVVSASGCTVRDSFRVVIQGVAPRTTVTSSDDYVCPGSTVTLSAVVSALACGPNSNPSDPCLPNSTFALGDLGSGAGSTTSTPYRGFWADGRVQYLYLASELQALGLAAGTITDIAFNITSHTFSSPYNNFNIKMGCTMLNNLPSSFVPSLSQVLNNVTLNVTTLGWLTHTLDVPYNWDGFSNLIIEVCYDNASYVSPSNYDGVASSTVFNGAVLYANNDVSSSCNLTTAPTQSNLRPDTRFVMCKAPLSNYSFTWTGSNGVSLADTSSVSVLVTNPVTYSVTVDDGTCQTDTFIALHVDTATLFSAGPDTVMCNVDTIQLNAHLLYPEIPYCIPYYTLAAIPYSAILPQGLTSPGPASDDVITGPLNMPFPFSFFCNSASTFYISSNGFVAFNFAPTAFSYGQLIPSTTTPNNLITMVWEDLNPGQGGSIDYFVSGTAPNRVLVVRWNNVPYYYNLPYVTGEIHLYETTNVIEIHVYAQTQTGQTNTLGIENADGTRGYSPAGYNRTGFTVSSPIAFRFTPRDTATFITGVQWSPSTGLSSDTVLNPLAFSDTSITYVITANFNNGCTTHDTIKVSKGVFNYTVGVVPDSICSGDSAQLFFNGNGVTYNWVPAQSLSSGTAKNPFAFPTATTTYLISAADSLGCTVHDSLKVNVRTHLPIVIGNNQAICPTDSVMLSPSGAPYLSYSWSTGDSTSSITTAAQTALTQDYFVKVNDGYCFYNSDTVTITEFATAIIGVHPAGDTTVCIGESIELFPDTGFLTYLWSNGVQTSSITVNTVGSYTYTALDDNGCMVQAKDSAYITLQQHPAAVIIASDTLICTGQTSAVLSVNPVAGIVYTWNPGGVVSDSFVVSVPGTYDLIASDNGCNTQSSIAIGNTTPAAVDLGQDINVCSCDTSVTLSSQNTGTYNWSTSETTPTIAVTQTGDYTLTVTDIHRCTAEGSVVVNIRCVHVDAAVSNPVSGIVFINQNATLSALPVDTNYSGTFNYIWSPTTYLNDSSSNQPNVIGPQATTTYTVTITDVEYGCAATDTVTLIVLPNVKIPMPNAFTPNDDGKNDTYGPVIPDYLKGIYTINQFRIYNRWGQQVHNNNINWDGKFDGTLQPAGTYVFYITINGPDENDPSKTVSVPTSGSFTLLH